MTNHSFMDQQYRRSIIIKYINNIYDIRYDTVGD